MNGRQVRGTMRGFAGSIEEHMCRLIGDRTVQSRGVEKKICAKAEKFVGDAIETIKPALRRD